MGEYVASRIVKLMIKKRIPVNHSKLLMLGITFKENCPDVRNTKIVDVIRALADYGIEVSIYDPLANPSEVKHDYNLITTNTLPNQKFDAIVLGVAHKEFLNLNLDVFKNENSIVYDVKGVLGEGIDGKL
jgi:UDP-N-acetyl-D-galactosamine dehydrogenase